MLKKGLLVLSAIMVAVVLQAAPVLAAGETSSTASNEVYSYFKSVELVIGETQAEVNYKPATMEQAAYVKQGRTLVPLRFIGESLGAQVTWNNITKQAIIKLGGSTMTTTIGSKVAYVDGQLTTLDVPAEIKGGRTFVPLRFVSESFGAYVDYDAETKSVKVRYADITGWNTYTTPKTDLQFLYPPDWTVTAIEDGHIAEFTSPKGSKLQAYLTSIDPSKLYTDLKADYAKDGWTIDGETLDVPGKIEEGFELDFSYFEPKINGHIINFVYVDPADNGSLVSSQLVDVADIEIDNIVMLTIAYS